MYLIGEMSDRKNALKLQRTLQTKGIVCELREDQRGVIGLFTLNEKDRDRAFNTYRVSVGLPRVFEVDPEWNKIQKLRLGIITKILILFSIGGFLLYYTKQLGWLDKLFFNSLNTPELSNIKNGEYWRLITPIFIHFNFMHIIFNMMWLKDLGPIMEESKGRQYFICFVLVAGTLSNFCQYLVSGPSFGGMSGVVYALLGHLWIHKKFHKDYPYSLPKRDVILMIGWFFLCFTGLFGPVANTAHGIGLLIGMIVGLFPTNFNKIDNKTL